MRLPLRLELQQPRRMRRLLLQALLLRLLLLRPLLRRPLLLHPLLRHPLLRHLGPQSGPLLPPVVVGSLE